MSKAKVAFLIIAILLIIAGGTLFGVCYAKGARFDNNIEYSAKSYDFTEDFDNINLKLDITTVEIVKGESTKVEATETSKYYHEVKIVDNTLTIESKDVSKWYEKFYVFSPKYKLKLTLAKNTYNSFVSSNHVGALSFNSPFTFTNVDINGSTSNIAFTELNAKNVKINTGTGSVEIDKGAISEEIKVSTSTGGIVLKNITAKNVRTSSSTASNSLDNVIASSEITSSTSTGSIRFDGIDAPFIKMEASTGSIIGSVLTEKVFVASSSTGSVNVPNTNNGGKCELKTSTGSINVIIKQ